MKEHPQAAAIAAAVVGRDSVRLAAAVTDTVRLRALLPGGPIEEHGRDAVVARFSGWFAGLDTGADRLANGSPLYRSPQVHFRVSKRVCRSQPRRATTVSRVPRPGSGCRR